MPESRWEDYVPGHFRAIFIVFLGNGENSGSNLGWWSLLATLSEIAQALDFRTHMFVPLAIGTSASEKNAPRNPWIIVFFFPRIITFPIGMPFFWVYHGISQFPTLSDTYMGQWGAISRGALLWRTRATDWNCPGTRQSFVARPWWMFWSHRPDRICCKVWTMFSHVFTTTWRENEVGGWHRGHHQGERYHCVLAL